MMELYGCCVTPIQLLLFDLAVVVVPVLFFTLLRMHAAPETSPLGVVTCERTIDRIDGLDRF